MGVKREKRVSTFQPQVMAGALLILATLACNTMLPLDPNERMLQGSWAQTRDQGEGHTSYLKWTFDHGRFEVDGYPPLHQTGRYRLMKSEGSTLVLQLYDQSGDWPVDEREIEIVLNSDGQSLTIDGEEPFQRTEAP